MKKSSPAIDLILEILSFFVEILDNQFDDSDAVYISDILHVCIIYEIFV